MNLLLLISFVHWSLQAGVSLHLLLVSRAFIPIREGEGSSSLGYLLAGSFYPDSFYNCLGLSPIGEYDHWTPFLYELVKYHNQLPHPDPDFKSFIYGILTHQITDITWHSLHLHQGLLKYIKNVEFAKDGDDYTKSHSFIDSGGDFIILDRLLQNVSQEGRDKVLKYFKTPWGIPTDHLVKVYHSLGYNQINEKNLNYCMLRGYTALQLEISSMFLATNNPAIFYREQSPLFTDILEDYYLGGLQEITHTLNRCLPNLEYWFDNIDKIKNSRDICNTMRGSYLSNNLSVSQDGVFISSYIPGSYFGTSVVTGKFLGDDRECMAISAPFEEIDGSIYIIPIDEFDIAAANPVKISSYGGDNRKLEYATRFGLQMVKFMDQFLLVSSPGTSSLSFYYNGLKILELKTPQSDNGMGNIGLKQLGILLEIDHQTQDIIIGSKYADYNARQEQQGVVFVLDGRKILMQLLQNVESSNPVISNINLFIKSTVKIPQILARNENYTNFASQYSSLNGYQAISVDNLGSVVIYFHGEAILVITHDLQIIYREKFDKITKTSSLQNSQFGSNFIKIMEFKGKVYLIISAKSHNYHDCIQCGTGFVFIINSPHSITPIGLILPSVKQNMMQFFQNALQISNDELLITSSNYNNNQGSIWYFKLSELIDAYNGEFIHFTLTQDPVQSGPIGSGYTQFGTSLAYANGKLIVGMPYFGYNELFDDRLKLIGKVGVYSFLS